LDSTLAAKVAELCSKTLLQSERSVLHGPRLQERFCCFPMDYGLEPTNSAKIIYQLNRTSLMRERPIANLLEVLLSDKQQCWCVVLVLS